MNDLSVNDYLTNLETDKEELVNNLNERGVDASTDETFTSLTKKVKTIGEGSMPYATEDIAGVIKVGKNLKMDNDGKLNASFDDYPTYEVILTTDFLTDTKSGGRGLSGNDRDTIWDMYHWAEEISQVSDYCVTYTFKNQPCNGSNRTFKKYLTHFYPKGTLPTEYLFSVCFGYYANGAIINGHGKTMGGMCVASLYFRFSTTSNVISVAVSYDSTGEHLVNTFALAKDNTAEYTPTGDYHPTTKLYVDNKINEVGIQFIEMPEASAEYVGKVFQYIGETSATYIKGHFYTCISDRAEEPTYQWTEISLGCGDTSRSYFWDGTLGDEAKALFEEVVTYITTNKKIPELYCIAEATTYTSGKALLKLSQIYKSSGDIDVLDENGKVYLCFANSYAMMDNAYDDIYENNLVIKLQYSAGHISFIYPQTRNGKKGYILSKASEISDNNKDTFALSIGNTVEYTPTQEYNPATKKYVDDQIGNINAVLATLVDIEEGE